MSMRSNVHLQGLGVLTVGLAAASACVVCRRRCAAEQGPGCILIIGLGYTGTALARQLARQGWRVIGTVRSRDSAERWLRDNSSGGGGGDRAEGESGAVEVVVFSGEDSPDAATELAAVITGAGGGGGGGGGTCSTGVTHVLVTAQPTEAGDALLCNPTLRAALLRAIAGPPAGGAGAGGGQLHWLGYLSSVGVYGDHGGALVTEQSELRPKSRRARRRRRAEEQWRELAREAAAAAGAGGAEEAGAALHILRLPGIYGPGRGPLEKVRGGTARCLMKEPPQVFSRIHVDDIVAAVCAALRRPSSPRGGAAAVTVYNVADDEPAPAHVRRPLRPFWRPF
jgi:nucleoside-diphosphate-sugar epimerase